MNRPLSDYQYLLEKFGCVAASRDPEQAAKLALACQSEPRLQKVAAGLMNSLGAIGPMALAGSIAGGIHGVATAGRRDSTVRKGLRHAVLGGLMGAGGGMLVNNWSPAEASAVKPDHLKNSLQNNATGNGTNETPVVANTPGVTTNVNGVKNIDASNPVRLVEKGSPEGMKPIEVDQYGKTVPMTEATRQTIAKTNPELGKRLKIMQDKNKGTGFFSSLTDYKDIASKEPVSPLHAFRKDLAKNSPDIATDMAMDPLGKLKKHYDRKLSSGQTMSITDLQAGDRFVNDWINANPELYKKMLAENVAKMPNDLMGAESATQQQIWKLPTTRAIDPGLIATNKAVADLERQKQQTNANATVAKKKVDDEAWRAAKLKEHAEINAGREQKRRTEAETQATASENKRLSAQRNQQDQDRVNRTGLYAPTPEWTAKQEAIKQEAAKQQEALKRLADQQAYDKKVADNEAERQTFAKQHADANAVKQEERRLAAEEGARAKEQAAVAELLAAKQLQARQRLSSEQTKRDFFNPNRSLVKTPEPLEIQQDNPTALLRSSRQSIPVDSATKSPQTASSQQPAALHPNVKKTTDEHQQIYDARQKAYEQELKANEQQRIIKDRLATTAKIEAEKAEALKRLQEQAQQQEATRLGTRTSNWQKQYPKLATEIIQENIIKAENIKETDPETYAKFKQYFPGHSDQSIINQILDARLGFLANPK